MGKEVELAVCLQELFLNGWLLSVDQQGLNEPVIHGAVNPKKKKRVKFENKEEFLSWVQEECKDPTEEPEDSFMLFTDDMYSAGEGFEVHSDSVMIYDKITVPILHSGILEINQEKGKRELGEPCLFSDPKLKGYTYTLGRRLVIITVPCDDKQHDIYLTYSALGQINHELLKLGLDS